MTTLRSGRRPNLVREVATRTPVTGTGHESLADIAALMRREDVSAAAILREGRLSGIIEAPRASRRFGAGPRERVTSPARWPPAPPPPGSGRGGPGPG